MDIVIIDGQGGGFGRALIEALRAGGLLAQIPQSSQISLFDL